MPRVAGIAKAFQVAAQQTVEATRKLVVVTAKRKDAEIMAQDPRPATFTRYVDGREGAAEETVKPGGVIVYRYPRLELVAQFAMETLFDLSPVLSGEYRRSHMLFINNVPVSNLRNWRPGQEVVISNPLPYTRKIELGKMKMRVPGTDLVYQRARRKVMARYGNLAEITFTFRALIGGYNFSQEKAAVTRFRNPALNRPATGAFEKTLRPSQHNKSDVRFPALVIREL